MNDIIDNGERQGPPSLWGEPFKRLIDHPKILPYLLELLGPHVRLDHDYAIFMEAGPHINGLHGGEDGGGPGGPEADHWYKYRDGIMRNGLSVMTYNLADAPEGAGGFACIPGQPQEQLFAGNSDRGAPIRASDTLRRPTVSQSRGCRLFHGSPRSWHDAVEGKTSTAVVAL